MTKILLVEDDKSLREIYGVRLLAEGYDIVSAGDGEEALAMAIKDRPALIVSDVMMPKISGFDMLDILRSTTETKNIKVIMMTALSSEDQRKRGEQLGADKYLVKSQVGIEDVVRAVHEVLGDAPTPPQSAIGSASPQTPPSTTPAPAATPPIPASPLRPAPPAPERPGAAPSPNLSTPSVPPATPAAPSASEPTPAPKVELPQPTAPFSTPRPGTLAERVIEPLASEPSDEPHVGDLIAKELEDTPAPDTPFGSNTADEAKPDETPTETSPTPPVPPVPTPPTPPVPPAPAA